MEHTKLVQQNIRNIVSLTEPSNQLKLFDTYSGACFLRNDKIEFPIIRRIWESSLALYWTVKMIDFSKDASGFKRIPEHAKRMFKLNNGYQSIMDSGATNIYLSLAGLANSPDYVMMYTKIAFDESIHADSYSSGLVSMFGSDAKEMIDIVYTDEVVKARLSSEIDHAANMIINPEPINIFKSIVAVYLLEHIKFPFSFFVTFCINNAFSGAINGFSQLLSRISIDEMSVHVPVNTEAIKHMIKVYDFDIKIISDMADEILESELEWNRYLQQDGSIIGYNEAIGDQFIKYYHDKALRDIGYKENQQIPITDSVRWFNEYRDPDNKQISQQEMKSTQYQKGMIKDDLDKLYED